MQRLLPRFRSQQFFLWKMCGETFYPNLQTDLFGVWRLIYVSAFRLAPTWRIQIGTNMAAGNQQINICR